MKKLIFSFTLVVITSCFSSCKQENPSKVINGIVYDASMNNITLITGKGDTVNIRTMDANTNKVGGILLNDSVEVTYVKEKIGGTKILKATEVTIFKK